KLPCHWIGAAPVINPPASGRNPDPIAISSSTPPAPTVSWSPTLPPMIGVTPIDRTVPPPPPVSGGQQHPSITGTSYRSRWCTPTTAASHLRCGRSVTLPAHSSRDLASIAH